MALPSVGIPATGLPASQNFDATTMVEAIEATRVFASGDGVRDINLEVPKGTIFGFIGPSGSGKTTTVRLLTGTTRPDSGTVRVLGRDPAGFGSAERARIGYMPQLSVLYDDLSVHENLSFYSALYGMRHSRQQRAELLEFVELSGYEQSRVRQISGGMRRRLSLAATLVHDPEVIFLDEPTAGIDPVLRRKFWDRFVDLKHDGRTLFVTTQYVGEAAYCDRVGVLSDGELILIETPDELRRRAYGGDVLAVRFTEPPSGPLVAAVTEHLQAVSHTRADFHTLRAVVDDAATRLPVLSAWLADQGIKIESAEELVPPFDDVFVELIEQHRRLVAENRND